MPTPRHFPRALRPLGLAAALALAAPVLGVGVTAPAFAGTATSLLTSATVQVSGDGLAQYDAAPGQDNEVTLSSRWIDDGTPDGHYEVTFDDVAALAISGPDCVNPDPADLTRVTCTTPPPDTGGDPVVWRVNLGDGDDTASVAPDIALGGLIFGGVGKDTLSGASELFGDEDDDYLVPGLAGAGIGGPGDDTITECSRCTGQGGNDTITGTDGADVIQGEDGDDIIHGGAGRDNISGGADDDRLFGDDSDDRLFGDDGDDILHGGAGTDTLDGGTGTNQVFQD